MTERQRNPSTLFPDRNLAHPSTDVWRDAFASALADSHNNNFWRKLTRDMLLPQGGRASEGNSDGMRQRGVPQGRAVAQAMFDIFADAEVTLVQGVGFRA